MLGEATSAEGRERSGDKAWRRRRRRGWRVGSLHK